MKTFLIFILGLVLGLLGYFGYTQYQKTIPQGIPLGENVFEPIHINTQDPVEEKKIEEGNVVSNEERKEFIQSYPYLGFSFSLDKEKFNIKENIVNFTKYGGSGYMFQIDFLSMFAPQEVEKSPKKIGMYGFTKNVNFGSFGMGGGARCVSETYKNTPSFKYFEKFVNKHGITFEIVDVSFINLKDYDGPGGCYRDNGDNFSAYMESSKNIAWIEIRAEKPIFKTMNEFKVFLDTIKAI